MPVLVLVGIWCVAPPCGVNGCGGLVMVLGRAAPVTFVGCAELSFGPVDDDGGIGIVP